MNITKLSRNDPCHCGSGKKYKQCCQASDEKKATASVRLRDSVPNLFNKAFKHQEAGELEKAAELYQQILTTAPKHTDTLYHLGLLNIKTGHAEIAVELLRKAIRLEPSAACYCVLAQAYQALNLLDDALSCLYKAIELNPGDANAYNNLGAQLLSVERYGEAIAQFQKSISLNIEQDSALGNLGLCLMRLGRYTEAIGFLQRAITVNPHERHYSNLLFCLCFDEEAFSETYLDIAHRLDLLLRSRVSPYSQWKSNPILPHQPLRVGLVSGDFRNHPVGYFLESLITHITPSKIELIAYNTQPQDDALTNRIQPYFSEWHNIFSFNDKQAAEKIHGDSIHILIDLSGYTANSRLRLFTWKPAPVQVSWLGYFASTGLGCMDFFLADPISVPQSNTDQFTETVWYLPHTRLCFTPPSADIGQVLTLPPISKNNFVTFGCFQNLNKISDPVIQLWAEILKKCPNSKILIKNNQIADISVKSELIERFRKCGILNESLQLEKGSPRAEYLESYGKVDFMLDTFPFPGGTTTCEALWMGVPTLTLAGKTLLERQGMSMLTNVGLNDWIANSKDDYIQKAIYFAQKIDYLVELRTTLRATMTASPLIDSVRFARDFEQAMLEMWQAKSYKNIH